MFLQFYEHKIKTTKKGEITYFSLKSKKTRSNNLTFAVIYSIYNLPPEFQVSLRNESDIVPYSYSTLLQQTLPGHSSKIEEPFPYHGHQ